jgi:hypothetical protein
VLRTPSVGFFTPLSNVLLGTKIIPNEPRHATLDYR